MIDNNGYIRYNSLNTIIQDLQNVIRNSDIAESENISRNQIEQWIHQYRALLIKQDLDKGRFVNQNYIQEINGLALGEFNTGYLAGRRLEGVDLCVSFAKIPKTIDLHFKNGIVALNTIDGKEIQLMPESRAMRQMDRKWTGRDPIAFMKEDKIYILGTYALDEVNVKGIFEVPTEVGEVMTRTGYHPYDYNDTYPVPANMIPVISEMIITKELGIMIEQIPDIINDGTESSSATRQEIARAQAARRYRQP